MRTPAGRRRGGEHVGSNHRAKHDVLSELSQYSAVTPRTFCRRPNFAAAISRAGFLNAGANFINLTRAGSW